MEMNEHFVVPEKLKGKVVEEVAITSKAVVIKFTDNTFFDIYIDQAGNALKTSMNKIDD